mgnify:CR=1 FL=1
MLHKLPYKPPSPSHPPHQPQLQQASAEGGEEGAASNRVPEQDTWVAVRRTPKQQRAARSDFRNLLSTTDTIKRVTKKKQKQKTVVEPRLFWR